MDIDNDNKKRKVDEKKPEPKNLEDILKRHMESCQEIVQVIAVIFQKIDRLERVLTNPLVKFEDDSK